MHGHSQPTEPSAGAINQITSQAPDKDAKHQPQIRAGDFVGRKCAGPRPEKHGDREYNRRLDVDVSVAVVLQGGTEANGRQQHRQTGSGRLVLRETGQVDQRGNDDDAAADAEKSSHDSAENTDS